MQVFSGGNDRAGDLVLTQPEHGPKWLKDMLVPPFTLDPLETYKLHLNKIVKQFIADISTFPQCITKLADELETAREAINPARRMDLADAVLLDCDAECAPVRLLSYPYRSIAVVCALCQRTSMFKRFDRVILKQLFYASIGVAVLALFTRSSWSLVGSFLGMFLIGVVGAQLLPHQRAAELSQSTTSNPAATHELLSALVERACMKVGVLLVRQTAPVS